MAARQRIQRREDQFFFAFDLFQIERLDCPAAVAQPRDRFCPTPLPDCLESVADRAAVPAARPAGPPKEMCVQQKEPDPKNPREKQPAVSEEAKAREQVEKLAKGEDPATEKSTEARFLSRRQDWATRRTYKPTRGFELCCSALQLGTRIFTA